MQYALRPLTCAAYKRAKAASNGKLQRKRAPPQSARAPHAAAPPRVQMAAHTSRRAARGSQLHTMHALVHGGTDLGAANVHGMGGFPILGNQHDSQQAAPLRIFRPDSCASTQTPWSILVFEALPNPGRSRAVFEVSNADVLAAMVIWRRKQLGHGALRTCYRTAG